MNEVSTVDFFPLAWVIHFARALMTFNVVNAMNKSRPRRAFYGHNP